MKNETPWWGPLEKETKSYGTAGERPGNPTHQKSHRRTLMPWRSTRHLPLSRRIKDSPRNSGRSTSKRDGASGVANKGTSDKTALIRRNHRMTRRTRARPELPRLKKSKKRRRKNRTTRTTIATKIALLNIRRRIRLSSLP